MKFFIKESFSIVNPGVKFIDNWHIDLISEYLESLTQNKINRLIINIPPRSLKSVCISVCWPAWLLGNDPTRRIICASYSQKLSNKLSLDCRHLINSNFFKDIFPGTTIIKDQNQKNKFVTSKRGFRLATSVGGTITGEGGNFLILDDPHNAIDIHSLKKRDNAICWFQQSFSSRIDDRKKGVIVIVMQRLHVKDLTGFLSDNKNDSWHVVSIPAIAKENTFYSVNKFVYKFNKNNLLHPKRYDEAEISNLQQEIGSYGFAAQYLQNPIAEESSMIKRSWLRYFDKILSLDSYEHIIQSWDTAIKSGDTNSYSVCTTWGKIEDKHYILEVFRERMEYPKLKDTVIAKSIDWEPDLILIEDKASGQSLIQDLKKEHQNFAIIGIKPKSDKITRFARVSTFFEQGKVFILRNSSWVVDYEKELLSFPNNDCDDQVDATSQYLQYIISTYITSCPNVRSL